MYFELLGQIAYIETFAMAHGLEKLRGFASCMGKVAGESGRGLRKFG